MAAKSKNAIEEPKIQKKSRLSKTPLLAELKCQAKLISFIVYVNKLPSGRYNAARWALFIMARKTALIINEAILFEIISLIKNKSMIIMT